MLRKKYEVDKEFNILIELVGSLDDSMLEIDKIMASEQLFKLRESDLSSRYPKTTKTGRHSTPVEVILRMLVLKHLRGLSYEKVIFNVNESLILRQFCRIYFHPIPNKSTLIRWSNQISQKTLEKFNQHLTAYATQLQITQGKKLRTDGTVVATNIHFPSDNTLLVDGVRVLSRILSQVKEILYATSTSIDLNLFRNRLRTARRISRQIDSLSKTKNKSGSQKRQQAYSKLIKLTQASFKQAEKVQKILSDSQLPDCQNFWQKFTIFLPRIEQVITQTFRRVIKKETVPSAEKIVSLFEAHTDIICRGKINVEVEFGHKVWLDEVDGGIISNYRILKGNPHDTQQLIPSLDQHIKNFGYSPTTVTADRGVYSQANENYAQQLGIKDVILPKGGYRNSERIQYERKRRFKKARHWHNGVEGRISFLKRCFGLERCLYRGESGFSRWVGWGIIAHNLIIMSRSLIKNEA